MPFSNMVSQMQAPRRLDAVIEVDAEHVWLK